ncbi:putative Pentatricopeptide repeat-containing protein [Cardiosporidium cionae]|uniref:tRNA (guanine(46)-N(7))-methyltransferase n=1 Tax=Cardiosporidium cionae TaxID=476202 RepID=A0ABQ7JBV0_9APIC|nr:putative Pentatricopeptide repeat-containing protein [Cardiosporidium cionae]|eukprot:KAF8821434.1 putative Pentatricopeptide repeat-containing protein [Cardiosporidium cionae]
MLQFWVLLLSQSLKLSSATETLVDGVSFLYLSKLLHQMFCLKTGVKLLECNLGLQRLFHSQPKIAARFVIDKSVLNSMALSCALTGEFDSGKAILKSVDCYGKDVSHSLGKVNYHKNNNKFQSLQEEEFAREYSRIKAFLDNPGHLTKSSVLKHFLRFYILPIQPTLKIDFPIRNCVINNDLVFENSSQQILTSIISQQNRVSAATKRGLEQMKNLSPGIFHLLTRTDETCCEIQASNFLIPEEVALENFCLQYNSSFAKNLHPILNNVDATLPFVKFAKQYGKQINKTTGFLLLNKLFRGNYPTEGYRLEIGAGTGDWIAAMAKLNRNFNWLAIELRLDRCHQIFSRIVLEDLKNCCLLGGNAVEIIESMLPASFLEKVFINFPQPSSYTDKRHWLSMEFFRNLHRNLLVDGEIILVTDNEPLCHQIAQEISCLDGMYTACHPGQFYLLGSPPSYEAYSSYFDRLWNNGKRTKRFHFQFKKVCQ